MTVKVKDAGGTLRTLTAMKVKDGSNLRSIVQMKMLDGATLRTVATFVSTLSASAPVAEFASSTTSAFITSGTVTCTPSGGLAPYTYVWTITSGTAGITASTSASTTFTKNVSSVNVPEYATAQCVVTDSLGDSASVSVSLTFELINYFGGA